MKNKELIKIDCLGDMCPVPLIKLQQHEKDIGQGKQIMLVTDHSCVSESIKHYCHELHYEIEIHEPINGVWEFSISAKGLISDTFKIADDIHGNI